MVDIKRLHVHYRDLVTGKNKVKKIKPTDNTDKLALKSDIAHAVEKIKHRAEYYYVVVEIDRDGQPAFRTIVPKTVLA